MTIRTKPSPSAFAPARKPAEGTRHLISLRDLDDDELAFLVERGADFARGAVARTKPLDGRVVGIYFRKTSTRTRTAFSCAALRLGAEIVTYGPDDLQENTGESVADTARVLSRMLDAFVARTAGPTGELSELAAHAGDMAVVNAMTTEEHPTQALADLTTMALRCGRLENLRVLYAGEGNNTAAALALALTRFEGTELELRTPPGYGLDAAVETDAQRLAAEHGASIHEHHHMERLPTDVDVVYTTRWQTTGTSKPDPGWRSLFTPFRVDARLMERSPDALFMHDLPAHRGEEVTAEVLDGPSSIAFEQAENKLHSATAVLEWCTAQS
jgi:ornithine carbamoyltransferase